MELNFETFIKAGGSRLGMRQEIIIEKFRERERSENRIHLSFRMNLHFYHFELLVGEKLETSKQQTRKRDPFIRKFFLLFARYKFWKRLEQEWGREKLD
jgi:hypothetical protein